VGVVEAVTDAWFRRRTSRWTDWDAGELLAAKQRSGRRVSLVIPARDEARTVGPIVATVRAELVEAVPLVDEVVVIDSDSTDDTAAVAGAAGALVHRAADVRPDLGTMPGKGEAMWKSLFVTTGDVLVFMDADLTEWGPHFVTGLLGPMLQLPQVQLVKGFYDRPLLAAGVEDSLFEGGRVTELVARPLLALRWPGLGGVVQPLAGEWAIRRELLEQLPVPTGYGVELGVLVDTYQRLGVDAIAQVDLGRRAHSHQPLRDLGSMALEILAVADRRAGIGGAAHRALRMRQYDPADGHSTAVLRDVTVDERPPAAEAPA
jgi:glucosyl-3-phosphoglycerate synthase